MKAYQGNCPCKGCEKRTVGCHGKCQDYKNWQKNGIEIVEPYYDHKKGRKRKK